MNIINQLEQSITPAVLGAHGNVAQIGLLEQFYALLITRLAMPDVYQQLESDELRPLDIDSIHTTLFDQLWQQPSQRHLLIKELAATHHIPEITAEPLLINAAHLAYRELNMLANGQFLPTFLQSHQATVRSYLPVWAETVVAPLVAVVTENVGRNDDALIYDNSAIPKVAADTERVLQADAVPVIVETPVNPAPAAYVIEGADALHATPLDYRAPDVDMTAKRAEIRERNRRNDLLIRLLIGAAALLAMLLLWLFVFKNKAEVPVETVVAAPVEEVVVIDETPAQILSPAQLMVSVDYDGNLYSCSAVVGDIGLETVLKSALNSSFGPQSSICQIRVKEGVATSLSNINIETLPNVLTLMRTTPFSRLQLQNDTMNLEGPDQPQLQRLLVDVRTLLPGVNITSAVPVMNTQPPANTYDESYNNNPNYNNGTMPNNGMPNANIQNGGMQNGAMQNGTMPNTGSVPITTNNNVISNQPTSPTGMNNPPTDSVPPPPPPQSSLGNGNNSINNNGINNSNQQRPSQQVPNDIDDLANTKIMSEPVNGGRALE